MFNIYFRPKALEVLKKIKREDQLKINSALDSLKLKKFNTLDLKRIKGTKNGWRLRVGRWRILFALFFKEKKIEIVDIFLRKEKEDYKKRIELLE